MTPDQFHHIMSPVFEQVAGNSLVGALARELNTAFPSDGETVKAIEAACHAAIDAGWMCAEGVAGRQFGRVIDPAPESHGLSVDVVCMKDFVGPHHIHPTGEIYLNMPMTPTAKFNGNGPGWCVFEPGSDHFPTVSDGEALVLYMLPGGEIDFTGKSPD